MHLSPHFNTAITIPSPLMQDAGLNPIPIAAFLSRWKLKISFCGLTRLEEPDSLLPEYYHILSSALPGVQQAGAWVVSMYEGTNNQETALGEKFEIAALRANEPMRDLKNAMQ